MKGNMSLAIVCYIVGITNTMTGIFIINEGYRKYMKEI